MSPKRSIHLCPDPFWKILFNFISSKYLWYVEVILFKIVLKVKKYWHQNNEYFM